MKNLKPIIGIIGLILIVGLASAGYFVFRQPEAPTAPIAAIPISAETATPEATKIAPTPTDLPPTHTPAPTNTASPTDQPSPTPTATIEPTATPEPTATLEPTPIPVPLTFEIISEQSTASFALEEELRGERITVAGMTNQLSGQIRFASTDLSSAVVGIIQINARTLETDNRNRNRAIQNLILDTSTHEFIQFEPLELIGLPDAITVGESAEFQILGDLTIKGIAQSAQFDATVTHESETIIIGTASTSVTYADFGVFVPELSFIANLDEQVVLTIDFVAQATE